MNKSHYTIPESLEGFRLDKALSEVSEGVLSRNRARTLIERGDVTLNGQPAKRSTTVRAGDKVEVTIEEAEPMALDPVEMALEIVHEDDDILVINKPSGLIVHPADTVTEPTLVHGLLAAVDDLGRIGDTVRPGIVHRIDKHTSGLLVVAKHEEALKTLQKALQARHITREYLALVEGVISHNKGKINAPIGRDPNNRKRMTVIDGGRDSVTHFEVVERFAAHTLIRCTLETGRTHQIRVHMRYIDHPVVGDPTYGRRHTDTTHGQHLHAAKLTLPHLTTNATMTFTAPLPEPFAALLERLRDDA